MKVNVGNFIRICSAKDGASYSNNEVLLVSWVVPGADGTVACYLPNDRKSMWNGEIIGTMDIRRKIAIVSADEYVPYDRPGVPAWLRLYNGGEFPIKFREDRSIVVGRDIFEHNKIFNIEDIPSECGDILYKPDNLKVGDIVRFREWDDMANEFGLNWSGNIDVRFTFIQEMRGLCGTEHVIKEIDGDRILLPDVIYTISKDMLEFIVGTV